MRRLEVVGGAAGGGLRWKFRTAVWRGLLVNATLASVVVWRWASGTYHIVTNTRLRCVNS